jgi:hypothetical protein
MMYIIIFIIVVFLISIFPFSSSSKKQIQNEIVEQNNLNRLININVTMKSKEYINKNFTEAIVLDEINKKIHLLSTITNTCKTFDFDELIESEVIIDNESITKFNRGNQIIGSVIGGVVAGVPGMIIGGLSSPTISSEKIKNITLKLTFNDMNNPICKIDFLNKSVSKDSHECKVAMNFIDRWYGYFTIILKQQNKAISN